MKLNESLMRNLKEAYEVGLNEDKLVAALNEVFKRYNDISNKYFGKETIQKMYQILANPEVYDKGTDIAKDLSEWIRCNEDGTLQRPWYSDEYSTNKGNKCFVFVYFPVSDLYDDGHDLVFFPVLSFGKDARARLDKNIGTPGQKDYFIFSDWDYSMGIEDIPYGEENKDIALAFLERKDTFLADYKEVCATVKSRIDDAVASVASEKKKDIADKQRAVADILNKKI